MCRNRTTGISVLLLLAISVAAGAEDAEPEWTMSPPLFRLAKSDSDAPATLLDPCAVKHGGQWHVFAGGPGGVMYYPLDDFKPDGAVIRGRKTSAAGLGVPQVYYHRASKKWHMVGQQSYKDGDGKMWFTPVLSVNDTVGDPAGWSKPIPMQVALPLEENKRAAGWMDFYVIFESEKVHLFGTSGGRLWRTETKTAGFPQGWSTPVLALKGNIGLASHTYRQDSDKGPRFFATITSSAQDPESKKHKQLQVSYIAEKLDGPWTPEKDKKDIPYVGFGNCIIADPRWNREIIHGEPLRHESDERMRLETEPAMFVFHAKAKLQDSETAATIDCLGILQRRGQ
ncbi:Alpha-L-arabinofuranosidase C precursor [Anatilimnocola aggregata]|uniref:non-reducing end alpha-L-arabinofuranosidase n=2 Tax=Anatilimnocola aggregata TaxID=2528021 RepID=A0A517YGA6_9BACT|nr:Alpha-L-arabinofuranosidase C precursor [Anatilimnocola aggregata]